MMAVCGTGDIGSCAAIVVERTTTASSPWVAAGIAGACRVSDALRNSSGCSPNYSTNHCIHAAIVHCGPRLQCVLSLHFPLLYCVCCKGFKCFPSFVDIYQYIYIDVTQSDLRWWAHVRGHMCCLHTVWYNLMSTHTTFFIVNIGYCFGDEKWCPCGWQYPRNRRKSLSLSLVSRSLTAISTSRFSSHSYKFSIYHSCKYWR